MTTDKAPAEIPAENLKNAARALHKLRGMAVPFDDLSAKRQELWAAEALTILQAANYTSPEAAKAAAWETFANRTSAAVRLISPDHITPVGARQILRTIEDNPFAEDHQ